MSEWLRLELTKSMGEATSGHAKLLELTATLPAEASQVTVLFGPSGSGKTSLLRCLAGLTKPDRGRIVFRGKPWFDSTSGIWLPAQNRNIGYLFQEYALFPHLSVYENLKYALHSRPAKTAATLIEETLELFGLTGLERRMPPRLSGGERQRAALARAVIRGPDLLLLDEPLSALDAPLRDKLRLELRTLLHRLKIPAIVVTHDRIEALTLGDHLAVLINGQIKQTGPVEDVFRRPANRTTAEAVGVENLLTPAQAREVGISVHDKLACIRAEDIRVSRHERGFKTALIEAIGREGPLIRATISVISATSALKLQALIPRHEAETLALKPGTQVNFEFDPGNVHPCDF